MKAGVAVSMVPLHSRWSDADETPPSSVRHLKSARVGPSAISPADFASEVVNLMRRTPSPMVQVRATRASQMAETWHATVGFVLAIPGRVTAVVTARFADLRPSLVAARVACLATPATSLERTIAAERHAAAGSRVFAPKALTACAVSVAPLGNGWGRLPARAKQVLLQRSDQKSSWPVVMCLARERQPERPRFSAPATAAASSAECSTGRAMGTRRLGSWMVVS